MMMHFLNFLDNVHSVFVGKHSYHYQYYQLVMIIGLEYGVISIILYVHDFGCWVCLENIFIVIYGEGD